MEPIDLIFSKAGLSENTKKAYLRSYNKLIDSGLFKRRISNTDNKKVIEYLHQLAPNPNSFAMLLNCVIILKRHFKKPDNVLVEYRNNQSRKSIIQHHAETNVELQKGLPTYQELQNYTENLYKEKKWLPFIINYLLLTFGCRNRDCDSIITYNKDNTTKDDNYLHIRQNDVVWTRNNYKTVKTYGEKRHIIRSRKFHRALTELNIQEGGFLLLNAAGERVSSDGIGGLIQMICLEKIGESVVFKILVKNAGGNYQKLKKLSDNRGTSVQTIIKHYDINTI